VMKIHIGIITVNHKCFCVLDCFNATCLCVKRSHHQGNKVKAKVLYKLHFIIITIITCNIEARSSNHCCRGKAISITYFCG
jgi:hypothetical protein